MLIFQRNFKERIQQQKLTQSRLREQKQQIARAKKYHNEYHVQHRARLMRARTKEERVGTDKFLLQLKNWSQAKIIIIIWPVFHSQLKFLD